MFRYAFLAYLWLVAIAAPDSQPRYWVTAPEMFDYSVARIFYNEIKTSNSYRLVVDVETIQFTASSPDKRCSFNLTAHSESIKLMNISTFRRLSKKLIALAWYEEEVHGEYPLATVMVLNMNNCKRDVLKEVNGYAIVVPSNDTLNIFFKNTTHANRVNEEGGLMFRYQYSRRKFTDKYVITKQTWYNHEFHWKSIRIERLPSLDFVVRGFQGNEYKVMRLDDSTRQFTELITLPSEDHQLEMFSRGLTFCWVNHVGHSKKIHCHQYDDKNELAYSTEVWYLEPMIITHLHSDREGMIGYFAAKAQCTDLEDCWLFTKKNFYQLGTGTGLHPNGYKSQFLCSNTNRKSWFSFQLYENPEKFWISVCTPSGDMLDTVSDCHRDLADRLYCMGNCTKL